jgi:hypothetical protein
MKATRNEQMRKKYLTCQNIAQSLNLLVNVGLASGTLVIRYINTSLNTFYWINDLETQAKTWEEFDIA